VAGLPPLVARGDLCTVLERRSASTVRCDEFLASPSGSGEPTTGDRPGALGRHVDPRLPRILNSSLPNGISAASDTTAALDRPEQATPQDPGDEVGGEQQGRHHRAEA
jgi:hypothetical protein